MQKYKVNQKSTSVEGTSLMGHVTTTHSKLVELFGEPKGGSADGKTTCEWVLEFENGVVGTIHDWKTESTPKELYDWCIGGYSYKILLLLQEVMNTETRICKF